MEEENKDRVGADNSFEPSEEASSVPSEADAFEAEETQGDVDGAEALSTDEQPASFMTKLKNVLKKTLSFIKTKIIDSEYFYLVGAFLLPVILMAGAHAAVGFFPFGNSSILSLDFQAQYIYYYENVRKLLTEGGSWLYTWSRTLGGEFMGYVAYYMGSPFNLLLVLFPKTHVALGASVVVLTKMGAMGTTMGIYLHKSRGTRDLRTVIFSTMYALCGYVAIQQYNPMWLDALIWLPLLVLGVERLVRERRVILYIVSLTLILTSNYYIGYMCCIFTVLYFVYYYLLVRPEILPLYQNNKSGIKKFFSLAGVRSFIRIALSTAVAIMMSSFMLLAAYYSLTFGKVGFSTANFTFAFRFDFLDVFMKMLVGSHDTVRTNGLPIIYSGLFALMLLPAFYMSKGISPRRKVLGTVLLMALLVSFLINPIDLAWHGFSTPQWLNYRYSFLFSFVVIVMACDAFNTLKNVKFGHFAASSVIILALACVVQKFDYEFTLGSKTLELSDMLCIGISVLFILTYIGLIYNYVRSGEDTKNTAALFLVIAISAELLINSIISVGYMQNDVGVVKYNNYSSSDTSIVERYDSYTGSVERLRAIMGLVEAGDTSFYRTESTIYRQRGGVNEQMAGEFYGISSSTSTLNKDVIRLMAKLGYASTSHWTKYLGGTPVGDALLGIKYVLTSDRPTEANGRTIEQNNKHSFDPNIYVTAYETDEPYQLAPSNYKIYAKQNTKALPIAYGVSRDVLSIENVYSMDAYRVAMDLQNEIINTMVSETLGEANVFKPLKATYTTNNVSAENKLITFNWDGLSHTTRYYVFNSMGSDPSVTYSMTAVADGPVYFHLPTVNFGKSAKIYVNGSFLTDYFGNETTCAMEIGTFSAGDTIRVEIRLDDDKLYIDNSTTSYFWYIDYAAMNEAFEALSNSALNVENYGNDFIKGNIYIEQGQELVFTTIPYDAGWNVYVDGKAVETVKVLDALLAFEVTDGYHEIEMRYFPTIYKIGIAVTVLGFAIFVLIVLYCKCEKFRLFVTSCKNKLFKSKKVADTGEDDDTASECDAEPDVGEPEPAPDAADTENGESN